VSHYLLNNLVIHDPILRQAMANDAPFFWGDLTPTAEEAAVLNASREFGIGQSGYTLRTKDELGRISVLSLNSEVPDDQWRDYVAQTEGFWTNLAWDLHCKSIAEASDSKLVLPKLSRRELECLKWISKGKTYAEIAIILNISEHTVRDYLRSLRHKLDSLSLAQAVAKASALGLI
jgi:DNA-binding CsgD family transcriptional regulator